MFKGKNNILYRKNLRESKEKKGWNKREKVYFFFNPVRRAAINPTLRPGGALREVVVGPPGRFFRPPPKGCEHAFIFEALAFGQINVRTLAQ